MAAVRYLSTERGDVAYQVFGTGDRTIVWTGPPFISLETRWEDPGNLRLWEFLATLGRVALFDYRGFGVSDPVDISRAGRLEEMAHDLTAIVDHLGAAATVVIATGIASMPALHVVATHPDAVDRLVLLNPAVTMPWSGDGDPREIAAQRRRQWGTGEVLGAGPLVGQDADHRRQLARFERISATPSMFEATFLALVDEDVSGLLPQVTIPALVVYTGDHAYVRAETCEQIAARMPNAVYVSRPSALFNWGEWDSDIRRFLTGECAGAQPFRDLVALLLIDIVDSTAQAARAGDAKWRDVLGYFDALVQQEVDRRNGRVVKQTGDGHLIEFARPSDAVSVGLELLREAPAMGCHLRAGVHFAEVERRPNGDLGGLGVHIAARIASAAGSDELVVSRTVREITSGCGQSFTPMGAHRLKGVPDAWDLYSVKALSVDRSDAYPLDRNARTFSP